MTPEQIRTAAEDERQALMMQARAEHQRNVEFELMRFNRELDNIERVFRLRLTNLTLSSG